MSTCYFNGSILNTSPPQPANCQPANNSTRWISIQAYFINAEHSPFPGVFRVHGRDMMLFVVKEYVRITMP